jgi:hypothetical protein
MKITCTKEERDSMVILLGKSTTNNDKTIYSYQPIFNKEIEWEITDDTEYTESDIVYKIDDLFQQIGYYVDFLGGQLVDGGEWKFRIKKGDTNGSN